MTNSFSVIKAPSYAKKKKMCRYLLFFACIFSNISQLPILMDNKVINITYSALWGISAVVMLFYNQKIDAHFLILPIVFDLCCVLFDIFCDTSYLNSNLFRPVNLCSFILIVGLLSGKYIDNEDLKFIAIAYIVSSFLIAVYLYINIFAGIDWTGTDRYLYSSKNSAGQIFLIAIVLVAFMFLKKYKFISIALIAFYLMLIFMMKSRSTILSLVVAIVLYILLVPKRTWQKFLGIFIFVFFIYLIFHEENLYNFFIKSILLNNKDTNDITAITSERNLHLEYFKEYFPKYWFMGTGGTYLESFPLAVLMSYGIFLGLPVLLFALLPLFEGVKNARKKHTKYLCLLVIILSLIMLVNGIFEELSPFGPGVKCYFLWLTTGLLLGNKEIIGI